MTAPARRLLGLSLEGGWKVIREVTFGTEATGATFSAGYIVERDGGERGFLKALDYSGATRPGVNGVNELQRMLTEYMFERDLVIQCTDKNLSRIVRGLGHGSVRVAPGLDGDVNYLIFELAAGGDIRRHIARARTLNLVWSLEVLHHVSTGLFQLHRAQIAHQDLKPSNVLVFEDRGSKIADLGCAAAVGHSPPHDSHPIPGDPVYAPPELLYKFIPGDWKERRFASDLYHLGSLTVFLLASANMTPLLIAEMLPEMHPGEWPGTYFEVLPHLEKAFGQALARIALSMPESVRDDLLKVIRELCDPDYRRRGHPLAHRIQYDKYSCERYISSFNRLRTHCERLSRVATP